jgi:hypothetical protein
MRDPNVVFPRVASAPGAQTGLTFPCGLLVRSARRVMRRRAWQMLVRGGAGRSRTPVRRIMSPLL